MFIPSIILQEILEHITKKPLINYRLINKEWYYIISKLIFQNLTFKDNYISQPIFSHILHKHENSILKLTLESTNITWVKYLFAKCNYITSLSIWFHPITSKHIEYSKVIEEILLSTKKLRKLFIYTKIPLSDIRQLIIGNPKLNLLSFNFGIITFEELFIIFDGLSLINLKCLCLGINSANFELNQLFITVFPKLKMLRINIQDISNTTYPLSYFITNNELKSIRIRFSNPDISRRLEFNLSGSTKLTTFELDLSGGELIISNNINLSYQKLKHISLGPNSGWLTNNNITLKFPNLQSLELDTVKLSPQVVCQILSNLIQLKSLFLKSLYIHDPLFTNLNITYKLEQFSFTIFSQVSIEIFTWINYCLPNLEELELFARLPDQLIFTEYKFNNLIRIIFKFKPTILFFDQFYKLAPNLKIVHLDRDAGELKRKLIVRYPQLDFQDYFSLRVRKFYNDVLN